MSTIAELKSALADKNDQIESLWAEVKYLRNERHRYRDAFSEILFIHANDNHRPKAFYIADNALNGNGGHAK